jgi:hypothetical protein
MLNLCGVAQITVVTDHLHSPASSHCSSCTYFQAFTARSVSSLGRNVGTGPSSLANIAARASRGSRLVSSGKLPPPQFGGVQPLPLDPLLTLDVPHLLEGSKFRLPLVDRITPSWLPPSISGTAETSTWAPWTGTPCSVPVINTPFNVSRNRERLRSGSERNAFRMARRHRCWNCLILCLSTSAGRLARVLNSSTAPRAITPLPAEDTSDLQEVHLN